MQNYSPWAWCLEPVFTFSVAISIIWLAKPWTLPSPLHVARSSACETPTLPNQALTPPKQTLTHPNQTLTPPSRPDSQKICSHRLRDGCDFLTQRYCDSRSTPLGQFKGKLAYCMGVRAGGERVSCALVGSSRHLLSAAEGERIDAHDVVIRMNSAPDGSGRENGWLAPCVGNRTTVRFMNQFGLLPASAQPEPCRHLIKPWVNCLPLNCYVNFDECSRSCDTRRSVLCKPGNPQVRRPWKEMELLADTLHPSVAQRILSNGTGPPYRTTGFIAFTYAIGNCDHVTVYGFGAACDGRIGVRYYKGGFPIVLDHAYDRERKIIEDIARLGPSSGHLRRTPGWMRAATVDISRPPCLQSLSGRAWQLADDHCKQPG